MGGAPVPDDEHGVSRRLGLGRSSPAARALWWALVTSAVVVPTAGVVILGDSSMIDDPPFVLVVVSQLVALVILLLRDIGRRRNSAAGRDGLTGLLTAERWHQRAGSELAKIRSEGCGCGLLVIDVDHLGQLNQDHGLRAGNEVLRNVAKLARAAGGRNSIAGRLAADEFALFVPDVGGVELMQLAEQIRVQVRNLTVMVRNNYYPAVVDGITVSIGVAVCPGDGRTLDDLLLTADMLLFAAQGDGYDRVRVSRRGLRDNLA